MIFDCSIWLILNYGKLINQGDFRPCSAETEGGEETMETGPSLRMRFIERGLWQSQSRRRTGRLTWLNGIAKFQGQTEY